MEPSERHSPATSTRYGLPRFNAHLVREEEVGRDCFAAPRTEERRVRAKDVALRCGAWRHVEGRVNGRDGARRLQQRAVGVAGAREQGGVRLPGRVREAHGARGEEREHVVQDSARIRVVGRAARLVAAAARRALVAVVARPEGILRREGRGAPVAAWRSMRRCAGARPYLGGGAAGSPHNEGARACNGMEVKEGGPAGAALSAYQCPTSCLQAAAVAAAGMIGHVPL